MCKECKKGGVKTLGVKVCTRCKHYMDRGEWKPYKSLEALEEEYSSRGFRVKFKKVTCDPCSKYASGYYEALIQLRADNKKAVRHIRKKLEELRKKDRYAFYRMNPKKNGVDFEIGSKGATRRVIRSLSTFNLNVKKSSRIAGMKDGKTVTKDVYVLK